MGYFEIYNSKKHLQHNIRITDAENLKEYLKHNIGMTDNQAEKAEEWIVKNPVRHDEIEIGEFIITKS